MWPGLGQGHRVVAGRGHDCRGSRDAHDPAAVEHGLLARPSTARWPSCHRAGAPDRWRGTRRGSTPESPPARATSAGPGTVGDSGRGTAGRRRSRADPCGTVVASPEPDRRASPAPTMPTGAAPVASPSRGSPPASSRHPRVSAASHQPSDGRAPPSPSGRRAQGAMPHRRSAGRATRHRGPGGPRRRARSLTASTQHVSAGTRSDPWIGMQWLGARIVTPSPDPPVAGMRSRHRGWTANGHLRRAASRCCSVWPDIVPRRRGGRPRARRSCSWDDLCLRVALGRSPAA